MRALTLLLLLASLGTKSQTIEVYSSFGGLRFERDSLVISTRQVSQLLADDPVAFQGFQKARRQGAFSSVLGLSGTVLIGIPVAGLLLGIKPDWRYAMAGATVIGVSIPFSRAFKRNAIRSVDRFNTRH